VTLPLAALVGFLLGVACYGVCQLFLRGPMMAQLLGTFGLMLLLRNIGAARFRFRRPCRSPGPAGGQKLRYRLGIIIPATKLAGAGLIGGGLRGRLAAHAQDPHGQGPDRHGPEPPGRPLHGHLHRADERPGLGHRRGHGHHGRRPDRQFLVGQSLHRAAVYHDRLCHRGPGRLRQRARGVFRRAGGGPDHRNPRVLGFSDLHLGMGLDVRRAHDIL
jgi:hypothetical protein